MFIEIFGGMCCLKIDSQITDTIRLDRKPYLYLALAQSIENELEGSERIRKCAARQ